MDLKGPPLQEKYEQIANVKVDLESISESIKFLNSQKEIEFEIRTTYVGTLLDSEDIDAIIKFLNKIRFKGNFVLQQYQFLDGVGEEYKKVFSKPEHDILIKLIEPYKNKNWSFSIFLRDDMIGYRSINEL
jgi:pyruvate-formate lyase-activating enzyme